MTKKTKQAYRQAPWRRQFRSLGFSLLPVIALVVVAALYLIISAQSAEAGLQIMDMHYEEQEILRQIANQRTELAFITSYKEMMSRSQKLGFEPVPNEAIHYMTIPGYQGLDAILLAPPPGLDSGGAPLVNEFYQESLWEWFVGTFLTGTKTIEGDRG